MPFKKGHTLSKGKGRPKGTGPRPVIDVIQALQDNNFDLIQEIINELKDCNNTAIKLRTMMGLLEYCVPKKKAVEVAEVEKPQEIAVTKENIHELYEVARMA
jgi:hypothetical protein